MKRHMGLLQGDIEVQGVKAKGNWVAFTGFYIRPTPLASSKDQELEKLFPIPLVEPLNLRRNGSGNLVVEVKNDKLTLSVKGKTIAEGTIKINPQKGKFRGAIDLTICKQKPLLGIYYLDDKGSLVLHFAREQRPSKNEDPYVQFLFMHSAFLDE